MSNASQINRNFYSNLLKRGRSHTEILFMIQPERRTQFYQDILPLLKEPPNQKPSQSRWDKFLKCLRIKK